MSDICISLAGSKMCPDFVAYSAYIPSTVSSQVSNIASFDALVQQSIETDGAAGFGSSMRSASGPYGYGCTGWDGTGLQYFQSTICAYFVALGIRAGDKNNITCNPPNTQIPLCNSTVSTFSNSFEAVLKNKSFCPNGPSPNAEMYRKAISDTLSGVTSTSSTCSVAQGSDSSMCGFKTAQEFTNSCLADPTQTCCANSSQTAPTFSATASDSVPASKSSTATGAATSSVSAQANATDTAPATSTQPLTPFTIIVIAVGGSLLLLYIVCAIIAKSRAGKKGGMASKVSSMPRRASSSIRNAVPGAVASGGIHEAIFSYEPGAKDELKILKNDSIVLKTEFDDGWGFGLNPSTMQQGYFPLAVLDGFGPSGSVLNNPNERQSLYGKRTSSYYSSVNDPHEAGLDFIYIDDEKPSSPQASQQKNAYSKRAVVYGFLPSRDDELEVQAGNVVELQYEYDDGWGYGLNLNSNKRGLFPLDCLEAIHDQVDENGIRRHSRRVSSVYKP